MDQQRTLPTGAGLTETSDVVKTGSTVYTTPTRYHPPGTVPPIIRIYENSTRVSLLPRVKPEFWNPGTIIDYINVRTVNAGQADADTVRYGPHEGAPLPGIIYGWDNGFSDGVFDGNGVYWNEQTGEIMMDNIEDYFLTTRKPYIMDLQVRHAPNSNKAGQTEIWTWPIEVIRETLGEDEDDGGGPVEQLTVGGGQTSKSSKTKQSIINEAKQDRFIDLNDPLLVNRILKKKPTGLQDSDVGFMIQHTKGRFIRNETGHTDIFADRIDSNIAYVLRNKKNSGDWDSTKA